ncbi:MAG: histidine kinase [Anaerolineae bacterium]|nr:histidine kinase [Anaerolineae bacterium]
MQTGASPFLADRISMALRWLALTALAFYFGRLGRLPLAVQLTLLLPVVWNGLLFVLSVSNRRLPFHPQISIIVDWLFIVALFHFTAPPQTLLAWAAFLPVVSAALYYGVPGAVLLALAGFLTLAASGLASLQLAAGLAVGGLALGFAGGKLHPRSRPAGQDVLHPNTALPAEEDHIKRAVSLTANLNTTLGIPRLLGFALQVSSQALQDAQGSPASLLSAGLLFDAGQLYIACENGFANKDLRVTLPGKRGLLANVAASALAQFTANLAGDPELSKVDGLQGCRAAYCHPLYSGAEYLGVLLFAHPQADYFNESRREILQVIGSQVNAAVHNARLYSDLKQEKARMMEIQEEARRKMARNLHDGPTQSVAAIAMRVNFARRLLDRDAQRAGEELFKIEELARRTTKEIRHMLFTLRPLVLESAGLRAALESMADKMRSTYNQNMIIDVDPQVVDQLEVGIQGVLFYIVEEAVDNARKHAEASHIWVRLKPGAGDIVLLEIEDDGVGFNIGALDSGYEHRGSLGMVNMRERTELVNGALQLNSQEGRGTYVRVWIPLTEEAAANIKRDI